MGLSSMQGCPFQIIPKWMLKEKDEFEFEVDKKKNKQKKNNKKMNKNINYVELSKKRKPLEKTSFKGSFIIQFDGEEPLEYIIGENISKNAEIVKMVYYAKTGDVLNINGENMTIVKKRM